MSEFSLRAVHSRLEALFASTNVVRLAYVFGSLVEGQTGPLSDVDVGVLVDPSCLDDPTAYRARLAHEIGTALDTDAVDLVLLNRAPIELAYRVIAQGERVYEESRAVRVDYEAYVLGRYGDYLPVLRKQREQILTESESDDRIQRERRSRSGKKLLSEKVDFDPARSSSGEDAFHVRLHGSANELNERLNRLRPLQEKSRTAFDEDPYLRDVVERNLEVAAQCCIDICNRTLALEGAAKPQDYYEAVEQQGELGVLPPDFARELAPLAGFRNVLAHQYLGVDWEEVYAHLHRLDDLERFAQHVRQWLREQEVPGE